jgi:hypothetical protein
MSTARTELAPPTGSPPVPSVVGLASAEPDSPVGSASAAPHTTLPLSTRGEWQAAGLSLLFHLLLLLVLAALLFPIHKLGSGTSIDGAIGAEDGDGGDLVESLRIGSPDAGKGQDVEKTAVTTVEGVPAVEGALAGSGSGSGTGNGRFDAVAALASGGGGSGGKGVGFFGTQSRADSVVFIVDMSGSMNDREEPSKPRRFDRAVTELLRSLNALQPSQRFYIFFYNNVTHPMFDQHEAKLVAATPGMRAKAERWVKSLHPDGDTAPEDAIDRALRLKPQVIYFLTDGEIPATTRDTAKRGNNGRKTVIHTIAFQSEEGVEMLRGIASDNRGKFRFVH